MKNLLGQATQRTGVSINLSFLAQNMKAHSLFMPNSTGNQTGDVTAY